MHLIVCVSAKLMHFLLFHFVKCVFPFLYIVLVKRARETRRWWQRRNVIKICNFISKQRVRKRLCIEICTDYIYRKISVRIFFSLNTFRLFHRNHASNGINENVYEANEDTVDCCVSQLEHIHSRTQRTREKARAESGRIDTTHRETQEWETPSESSMSGKHWARYTEWKRAFGTVGKWIMYMYGWICGWDGAYTVLFTALISNICGTRTYNRNTDEKNNIYMYTQTEWERIKKIIQQNMKHNNDNKMRNRKKQDVHINTTFHIKFHTHAICIYIRIFFY